ncbi:MAG TPA: bifunctional phosphoribosylaminoimidazolecarboxamide formyltransferase/IMP cyclohydrolase, partial [Pyrinomonadaceae bacterium]|nr:bifunctional phosphoribosylaminoimidazolecarboxamide formyltransferase/IMP cyclohydrolase [Pyrinomonadaceae bacterium]
MNTPNKEGLRTIRRALLSVSDKSGLVEFARALAGFGVEILSTGGTAKALREAGLEVRDVSDVTGFPEMLDGRVKTLHPRVHGGILAVRDNEEHLRSMAEHGIEPIDMVVVNLYPFEQTVAREGVTLEEAVEQIDIGGPAMVRSSAKNYRDVAVVTGPDMYAEVMQELEGTRGALSLATRERLALMAFVHTGSYDSAIAGYLNREFSAPRQTQPLAEETDDMEQSFTITEFHKINFVENEVETQHSFPSGVGLLGSKKSDLRYGENPHQRAALYELEGEGGVARAELLGGKEMSFNNFVDADAAWQLVCDIDEAACAIIKHMNPSGVGAAATLAEGYRRALATDPVSAFGGIVAFNRTVDEEAARAAAEIFTEVVIAPDFDDAAIEVLKSKKNLRILRAGSVRQPRGLDFKRITGGLLVQTRDTLRLTRDELKVVTKRAPTEEEIKAL